MSQENQLQFGSAEDSEQEENPQQATGRTGPDATQEVQQQAEQAVQQTSSSKVDEQLQPLHRIVQNLSDTNQELEQRTTRLADLQEVLSDEIENYLSLKEAHDQYVENIAGLLERAGIDPSEVFGREVSAAGNNGQQARQQPSNNQSSQDLRSGAIDSIREEVTEFMKENDVSAQQMLKMLNQ